MLNARTNAKTEPTRKAAADLSPAKVAEIGRRAGLEAAQATHAVGRPVVTARDGWIVEVWPDGRMEKIEPAPDYPD